MLRISEYVRKKSSEIDSSKVIKVQVSKSPPKRKAKAEVLDQ